MLDNFKVVLLEHKKFLIIFFLVVFVPSIILAFFGIRAINSERYKLQQINLNQQQEFLKDLKAEVQAQIEREFSGLREISTNRALIDGDYQAFNEAVSGRFLEEAVVGRVVIWDGEYPPWFPGLMIQPLSNRTPAVPLEWGRLQADRERAERAELRLRNFSEAISLYRRILQRSKDNQVRAWILSRIARCEIKNKNFEQALNIYRSMIEDFPDMFTESGRPLDIVCRMQRLDILLAENDAAGFFLEFLKTLECLERKFWELDGSQAQTYAAKLLQKMKKTASDDELVHAPADYRSSIADVQNSIESKLEMWRTAEAVKQNLLPNAREKKSSSLGNSSGPQKNVLDVEGKEILVLLLPSDRMHAIEYEFLGSILEFENLRGPIGSFIESNAPQSVTVVLRSNLSGYMLYGENKSTDQIPVMTDFFPENFPPWKIELYQNEGPVLGPPLYRNIFFWIVLALLSIVFFGSGLIIRTLVQETNLLNLKSEFIASVSHEFKTPLTAMGAILERLESEEVSDSKKIREYHRILKHDAEKLKRLVKNVLDFSKIEDGKLEYKLIETDITGLVSKESDSFSKENRMAGFEVAITLEDEIPPVLADEEALSQALHNILDNAAKFSGREKKIDVTLSVKGDRVEIAVQDRGLGIDENEQKRVFEKFYRGKRASSLSTTGTGLGLTLVKHIMDGHGGSVAIQSQAGKGTRVSLILPQARGG